MSKHIVWFSAGAASAIVAKIVSKQIPDAYIYYCDTGSEHPDNFRFIKDIENWINNEIIFLKSSKYKNINEVFDKKQYLSGIKGAPCTTELKRNVRIENTDINDIQYWGYTLEEKRRAENFSLRNNKIINKYPLIEYGIKKQDCIALLNEAKIKIPAMYNLGYDHNNCIGCVKSSSPKYWNMIRKDFPEEFKRRAEQERKFKYSLCKVKGKPIYLDELSIYENEHNDIDISCDLGCQAIYNTYIIN